MCAVLEFAFEEGLDVLCRLVAGRRCTLHHQVRLPDHFIARILHQKPVCVDLGDGPTATEYQDQQQIYLTQQFHNYLTPLVEPVYRRYLEQRVASRCAAKWLANSPAL